MKIFKKMDIQSKLNTTAIQSKLPDKLLKDGHNSTLTNILAVKYVL